MADSDDLPDPDVLAQEIVDDMQTALDQFGAVVGGLGGNRELPQRQDEDPSDGPSHPLQTRLPTRSPGRGDEVGAGAG